MEMLEGRSQQEKRWGRGRAAQEWAPGVDGGVGLMGTPLRGGEGSRRAGVEQRVDTVGREFTMGDGT